MTKEQWSEKLGVSVCTAPFHVSTLDRNNDGDRLAMTVEQLQKESCVGLTTDGHLCVSRKSGWQAIHLIDLAPEQPEPEPDAKPNPSRLEELIAIENDLYAQFVKLGIKYRDAHQDIADFTGMDWSFDIPSYK